VGTFPDAQPTQPGSTLGEENALMQRAMSAARRGEEARAVELLSQLLVGYPGSPLAQNAEVERFRAMRRLGDVAAASRAARRYLGVHQDGMARDEARRLAVEQPARSSTAAAPR
jgi:outer membrane protein assembly factor BamD (BamD/ComL family)